MKEKIKQLQSFFLVLMMLIMGTAGAWADTTILAIDFKNQETVSSITAGSTKSFVSTTPSGTTDIYFKSATTHAKNTGVTFGGNASTSQHFMSFPLSGINGSITVTVTYPSARGMLKCYLKETNAAPTSSDISGNPSSLTLYPSSRPASNKTSETFTINASKSYGVFYIGRNNTDITTIESITITTPSGSSTYTVTYDGNGSDGGTDVTDSDSPYASGSNVTVKSNTWTKTGYTFSGWNTEDGGSGTGYDAGDTFSISANTTLYAQWTANNYAITLDKTDGSSNGSATATYDSGTLSSITKPTYSGYQVEGYYDDGSYTHKVASANGTLLTSVTGYTNASGNWIRTSATTLYTKWEVASSDRFHFVATTSNSGSYAKSNTYSITTSDAASVLTGGTMSIYASKDDSYSNKGIHLNSDNDYLQITLSSGTFAVGDVITVDATNELCFTNNGTHSATNITSSKTYTITSSDGLSGKNTIYVHRGVASGTKIKEITITQASSTLYTVSFADGTCGDHGTYTGTSQTQGSAGAEVTLPTAAADTGWRFDGWYTANNGTGTKYSSGGSMVPTSNQTLYAWYVQTFTVTYDDNGKDGGGAAPTDATVYDTGSTVTVLGNTGSMTKTYYTFAGWNTSNASDATNATHYNADEQLANISANTTFYAVWKHQVTLGVSPAGKGTISAVYGTGGDAYYGKAAGDAFTSGDLVSHDIRLILSATPNTGYHFAGSWGGTSSTDNPADVPVDDNKLPFTANFAANTYEVAFNANANDATGTMANQSFTYDESAKALTTNGYSRTGYTFDGWNTAADGSGTDYANGASVQNLTSEDGGTFTLYAKWRQNATITVTFVDNHSKGTMPDAVESSTLAATGVLDKRPSSVATGYTFKEWCTDAALTVPAVAGTTITENTTLYANYTINDGITVSPVSGSTLTKGLEGSNSVTSTQTGMTIYAAWGGAAQSFETVIGTTGKASPRTDGFTYTDAGSTKMLSLVASDGTFYSDVQTFSYTTGTVAPVITFSPNTVTITCETAGATIYYTTDGTTPTSSSTAYSAPFTINADQTIKAIAIKTVDATPYSSAVTTLACTYEATTKVTTLPVTYDFTNTTYWTESTGNFGTSGSLAEKTNRAEERRNQSIWFRKSADNKFVYTSGVKMTMNDNASSSNYIAIPISGITGRIDINVWAPYSSTADYTLRYVLDTSHGTTVQSSAPSGITTKKSLNKYDTDHYNFRIENIAATSGVLYLGRGESTFPDFEKIQVTTQDALLKADKTTVTIGDAQTDTLTITNNTIYQALLRTVPSCIDASYDPTTGKLAITPKAIGSGTLTMSLDTNGDGVASSDDLSVTVNVRGITIGTNPTSAVYDTSGGSPSPDLSALTVSATHSGGASMTYQWYKNSVNSNEDGTAISGATGTSLATSKISTTEDEDASFYYCVVSSANCKSKTSDVAYVLTSKTKRYFQMSNVAGNKETAAAEEKITGQVIAGGTVYEENTASNTYRYITRPNTSTAHTYIAGNTTPSSHYFKVELPAGTTIATGDHISVQLNGLSASTIRGIYLTDDASVTTGKVEMSAAANDGIITKGYTVTGSDCLTGKRIFYIVGKSGTDYFTDLIIFKTSPLAVSDPTPASQALQVGDTPATISVTATGGSGEYTYQWYRNTEESTTGATAITGATSASYSPKTLTAESVDSVYYCLVSDGSTTQTVPTGYATITVSETYDHGYMTIDGTEHGGMTFSFTDGKCSYMLQSSEYNTQNKAAGSKTQHTNFWTHEGSFSSATLSSISPSSASYLKLAKTKKMTFYVRKATSFTIESGTTSSRQYTVTVDGVLQGTYNVGTESARIPLNVTGSEIVITNVSTGDEYFGRLNFYNSSMRIMKNGEAITEAVQYTDNGTVDYEVSTNSAGAITATSSNTGVATAAFTDGLLKVTSVAEGTTTITLTQAASGDYALSTTTLLVTVKKHTLALEFSLEETEIPLAVLSSGNVIPSGSLPTLSVKLDGETLTDEQITDKGIEINYQSDDTTIGSFGSSTTYAITYGGGQGGALIYAYVNAETHISAAKDYFGLNIKAGTSNAIPSGTQVKEQQRFELQDDEGASVVTLTYGGYRFDDTNGWAKATSRGKYHIDGYNYYTRHSDDALDEYKRQLRGMLDETVGQTKALSGAPDADFWYETTEARPSRIGGNYSEYERIRPLTLPSRGGYLKFQTHKTGTLTIYVWQNGSMNTGESTDSKKLGSKPRLGYWFDQDGWVKKPKVAPITKTPLTSKSYGRDVYCSATKSEAQLTSKWTAAWGDADIVPMLLRPYCNSAKTDFSATEKTGYIANPYYWMTQSEIEGNLDEEQTIIPKKMTPVPYHNGYMVPEESYLKYVIDVVAGKTYYFYGMMTKVGYVGMNFIENNDVADVNNQDVLHLNNTDDMVDIVDKLGHDYTVYSEVTMPSNYRKGKWNTICLPFALSEQQVEEAFGVGTQLTLYNGLIKKGTDYTIKYLSHVDGNILPGQPYFIKPSGVDATGADLPTDGSGNIGSTVEGQSGTRITFNVVCIDKKQFDPATCIYSSDADVDTNGDATDTEGFKFTGTYAMTPIDQYSYLINVSTGNLRQYTGATTIAAKGLNPYHAFLKPNHADVKHNAMSQIDFETNSIIEYAWLENETPDIPTEVISLEEEVVDALNSGRLAMPDKAYNIMGQEIDPRSAKGLVIINGKKVLY